MIQRLLNSTTINVLDSIEKQVTPAELMYAGRVSKDKRLFAELSEDVYQEMSPPTREKMKKMQVMQAKLMEIHD